MSRGITKIEILIVAALIILMGAGDIFIWLHLKNKTRDIYVLSDISQIRSALDVYLTINTYYPKISDAVFLNDNYAGTEKLCLEGFKRISDNCVKIIQSPIPNSYLRVGNNYMYKSDGANYQLQFYLTTDFPKYGLTKGVNCATNISTKSLACF